MIVEQDKVARPQLARGAPLRVLLVTREPHDTLDAVIGGQAKGVTFYSFQPNELFSSRSEKTICPAGVVLPINSGAKRLSHQIADLAWPLAGVHPRIARHARIGSADLL